MSDDEYKQGRISASRQVDRLSRAAGMRSYSIYNGFKYRRRVLVGFSVIVLDSQTGAPLTPYTFPLTWTGIFRAYLLTKRIWEPK